MIRPSIRLEKRFSQRLMDTRVKPAYDTVLMRRVALPRCGSSMTTDALPLVANADYLTATLRKFGVLGAAPICNVTEISSFPKLRSFTRRLHLDYEGPAEGAPDSV